MLDQITQQANAAVSELIEISKIKSGDIMVIGCSSSEVGGEKIGTHSSPDIAKAIVDGILPVLKEKGIIKELKKRGADENSTIRIKDIDFEIKE